MLALAYVLSLDAHVHDQGPGSNRGVGSEGRGGSGRGDDGAAELVGESTDTFVVAAFAAGFEGLLDPVDDVRGVSAKMLRGGLGRVPLNLVEGEL